MEANTSIRKVFICTNGKCINANRSRELFDLLSCWIQEYHLDEFASPRRVKVSLSGCLDVCENGPVMVIQPDRIFYNGLDEKSLELIFHKHLLADQVVEEQVFRRKSN